MDDEQRQSMIEAIQRNGIDWYAVLETSGAVSAQHETALSAILQCGHDPARYGYRRLVRCGAETAEDAAAALDELRMDIGPKLYADERELRVGCHVAYGRVETSGSYALIHAPTQADFDVVAQALEGLTPDEIAAQVAGE